MMTSTPPLLTRVETNTSPPEGVYLTALLTRLVNT